MPPHIAPVGETSAIVRSDVPYVYVLTDAEPPLQFCEEGACSCEVCENATDRPVVCGCKEMETGWVVL